MSKALLQGEDIGFCPPFALINPDDTKEVLNHKGEKVIQYGR
jgi:hypothetical protein